MLGIPSAAAADSATALTDGLVTNGEVYTSTTIGTTTYVGGAFTYIGPSTGPGVPVDPATGRRTGTYPKFSGAVVSGTWISNNPDIYKAVADKDGGWYVGGSMTAADGTSVTNLVHIKADGTLDSSFLPVLDGLVYDMELSPDGSKLYVGGAFTTVNGNSNYSRLVALNTNDGSIITGWDPNPSDISYPNSTDVQRLSLSSDGATLYIGGRFTSLGGQSRVTLGAVDTATGNVTAWNPNPYKCSGTCYGTSSPLPSIYDIEADGAFVYIAGSFDRMNGSTGPVKKSLARVSATTGTVDAAWTIDPTFGVQAITVSASYVYLGGYIGVLGGTTRYGLAKIDKNGNVQSWDPQSHTPNTDLYVTDMVLSNDESTLYFTGAFVDVDGTPRTRAAAVSTADGSLAAWDPDLESASRWDYSGRTLAFNSDYSKIYIGGSFISVNGKWRDNVAAIDVNGNITPFNPKVDIGWAGDGSYSTVYAVTASPDNAVVYIGGDFTLVNNETRNYLAAVDSATGATTSWNPDPDGEIWSLETNADGSVVFVGGYRFDCLNNYSDCSDQGFTAIDAATGLRVQGWGVGGISYSGGTVYALKRSGSKLYVGGDFTYLADDSQHYYAVQVNIADGRPTAWLSGLEDNWNDYVTAIAVSPSAVYLSGYISSAGCDMDGMNCTDTRHNVVALSKSTGALLPWAPLIDDGVSAMYLRGTTMFIGGEFTSVEGQSRSRLAALDTAAGADMLTLWDPSLDNVAYAQVNTLTLNDTVLYAGGFYANVGTAGYTQHMNLSSFVVDPSPPVSTTPVVSFGAETGSGLEKVTPANIEVLLTIEPTATTTVEYAVTGGTAAAGTDYTLASGTLAFAPGVSAASIPLVIHADQIIEPDETVVITLSNPSGATLGTPASYTYTILDDDTVQAGVTLTKSAAALNLTEGGAAGTYTLVLDAKPAANVVITMTSDSFSTTSPASVTFTPSDWDQPQTISVTAIDRPAYTGLRGSRITHAVASSDPAYNNLQIARISLSIMDNLPAPAVTAPDEHSWNVADASNAMINQTITASDGTMYFAGNFDYVGKDTGNGAVLRRDTGNPDFPFPYITSSQYADTSGDRGVYAAVPDGAGGWYVGGSFNLAGPIYSTVYQSGYSTVPNSYARNNLVHILQDGSVDQNWDPDPVGSVYALERDPKTGILYVGGAFTSIGGKMRNRIASLNSNGTVTDWNPNANDVVTALKLVDGSVYVGGRFTTIGDSSRSRLAALNDCGIATAWDPNANGQVDVFATYNGHLYAGGEFTKIGGLNQNFLVSFTLADGSKDEWSPDPYNSPQEPGFVRAMLVDGSTLYIGGDFLQVQNQVHNLVAAIDLTTGNVTDWSTPAITTTAMGNPFVKAIALNGNDVMVGGYFNSVGGVNENYFSLAAFDKTTGAISTWDAISGDHYDTVSVLVGDSAHIYVGGDFGSVGGRRRYNIAAIDNQGSLTGFAPKIETYSIFNGILYSLAIKDNVLFVGGDLGDNVLGGYWGKVNGQPHFGLMSFNLASGGTLTNFNPEIVAQYTLYYGNDTKVVSMKVVDNMLYIGGAFNYVGGQSNIRRQLAAFDVTNPLSPVLSSWTADLGSSINGATKVGTIESDGNVIYVGGYVRSINGLARNGIGILNKTTGTPYAWNPTTYGYMYSDHKGQFTRLKVQGSALFFSGDVGSVNGVPTIGAGVFDISSSTNPSIQSWNPNLFYDYGDGSRSTTTNAVIFLSGNELYLGGRFNQVEGQTRGKLVRYDISNPLSPVLTDTQFLPDVYSNTYPAYLAKANGVLWEFDSDGSYITDFRQYGLPQPPESVRAGFSRDFATAPSGASVQQLPIALSAPAAAPVTISYTVTGGTAVAGVDYVLDPGTVTIPAGEMSATIPLQLLAPASSGKTVNIALSSPSAGIDLAQDALSYEVGYSYTPPACSGSAPSCGVTLSVPGALQVSEGGPAASYTLVLDTQPTSDVVLIVAPAAGLSVATSTLVFTSGNWNVPQTVSVSAPADGAQQGNRTVAVSHAASSADSSYNGISIGSVNVLVVDTTASSSPATSTPPSLGGGSGGGGGGAARFDFAINGGASSTASQLVTLGFTYDSTVVSVDISSRPDFSNSVHRDILPVLGGWDLCPGSACSPGLQIVYVKYYTASHAASQAYSHSIMFTPSGHGNEEPGKQGQEESSVDPICLAAEPDLLPASGIFTKDLKPGDHDQQVIWLQQFLNGNGYLVAEKNAGSPGNETNFFGGLTLNALRDFQERYRSSIEPYFGTIKKTGFLDKPTRDFLNGVKNGWSITACAPVKVVFGETVREVQENVGTVNIPIVASATTTVPVIIHIEYGGSGSQGVSFTGPETVVLASGTQATVLPVVVLDNSQPQADRTVTMSLENPVHARAMAPPFTLIIHDDDPSVIISDESDSAAPGTGQISVTLSDPPTLPITVTLTTGEEQVSFSTTTLVFTAEDWDKPQIVTIVPTGEIAGEQAVGVGYEAESSDGTYYAADPDALTIVLVPAADGSGSATGTETSVGQGAQEDQSRTVVGARADTESRLEVLKRSVRQWHLDSANRALAVAVPLLVLLSYLDALLKLGSQLRSFVDFWMLLVKMMHGLLTFFGLRRKRRYWGTVYDSQSKQPIDPAIVRLVNADTGEAVEEVITDMAGRYGFLVRPGRFYLEVSKAHFRFPSLQVTGQSDEIYDQLYHGEVLVIQSESDVLAPNIPLDPLEFDWNQQDKQRIVKFHPRWEYFVNVASSVLLWAGFALAILNAIAYPGWLYFSILGLYVLLLLVSYFAPRRLWGRLIRNNGLVSGLLLELHPAVVPTVTMGKAKSSGDGKFFLKSAAGTYQLIVKLPSGQSPEQELLRSMVTIGKEGIYNKDIEL